MNAPLDMNVLGYTRVSGVGQIDGHGLDRQELAIREFCAAQGIQLQRVFVEPGVSGTVDGLDRPVLCELLLFVSAEREAGREVHGIVIERLDRLARDLMVSEALIGELRKHRLKLFAADQGALLDLVSQDIDPMRKAIRQIMGVLAELDKSMLVLKLRKARDHKRRTTGRCEGRLPFGSTAEDKPLWAYIFGRRQAGASYSAISRELQAQGVAGNWTKDRVRGVLRFGLQPRPVPSDSMAV